MRIQDRIFSAVPSRHVGMCLDMAHFDGANVNNVAVVERSTTAFSTLT